MKKKLLFLSALVLSSVSAFAQWALPEVKGSDLVSGDTCYIYNKEAGAFLRGIGSGAPYWGTRAGVSADGAVKYVIKQALAENVEAGTEVSNAYDIPWMAEWDGQTYIINGNDDEIFFGLMDFTTIWVDRKNNYNANVNFFWNFEKNANGTYYISCSKKSTVLADPELYAELTVKNEETGEITSAPVIVGGEKLGVDLSNSDLVACFEGYNDGAALSYEWILVSQEDYAAIDFEGFSRYYEAISLKNLIDESKAAYPEVDFSAAEAVYNNTASTLAELQAAKDLVKKAIVDFQSGGATPDNPKDMTSAITNASFDIQGDFTGWEGSGFNAGGDASTAAELWNWSSFNTYQNIQSELPNGVYKVGVKSFYRAGGINEDWETKDDPTYRLAKLYAVSGEDSLYVSLPSISSIAHEMQVDGRGSETPGGTYVPNSMKDFTAWKEAGLIPELGLLVPVSNGKLRIGVVKKSGFGGDWFMADDFTLTYYGNSAEAYAMWRDEYLADVPNVEDYIPEDAIYNQAYRTAVEEAIATAKNSTDMDVIKNAIKQVDPAIQALVANINAYAAYVAKVTEVEEYFATNDDLAGDSVDYITDYLGDESLPGEVYPNGGAVYIKENAPLTTEEIIAETENVERWFQSAVKNGMHQGSDVSFLLVNPSFADGFNGWYTNGGNVGGIEEICPNVEIYENHVDVYQTVEGVPAGIYSISVQAFERPASPWDVTGDETSKVFLFMNDYQSPVMQVTADLAPYDTAQDRVNSYFIDKNTGEAVPTSSDKWPYDYGFDGTDKQGWMPHSMDGASYAFAGGRYVNKCYGIVGDDGVMKIGLTSNGVRAHWVIWANFKLVYEGENAEALEFILETTIKNAQTFMEDNSGAMNSLAINTLSEAMVKGEEAYGGEYDAVKAALDNLTAALAAAREHVDIYNKLLEVQFNMDETAAIYGEIASVEALEAYSAASMKFDNIDNMTNEEIIELTKECEYITAALKLPSDLTADDENPLDLTSIINNPDFSMGNASGWTYHIDPISNLGYQGASYNNGDVTISQFIEGWRSGSTPMGNGTIEQTINALPEGTYVLGVDLIANNQKTGSAADSKGIYLFASESDGDKSSIEVATDNGKPQHFELTFKKVSKTSTITIGVEALNATSNWVAADNFTLTYYGTGSALTPSEDATGIESVNGVEVITSSYYTLGGAKVAAPVKGINIVKSILSDGSVKVNKILVK